MDDTNLSAAEEQQLSQDLAAAPDDLKQSFCGCWPAVKELLEWLSGKTSSGLLKSLVKLVVWLGDRIYKALDCEQKAAPGAA
jgi:hypothetical protein